MAQTHPNLRIDATYRKSLLLALIFGLINIPLTWSPFLNSWPIAVSGAFAGCVAILWIARRFGRGPAPLTARLLFLSLAFAFILALVFLAAPGVNVNFYLLPVVAGGVFLLSDTRVLGSLVTALALTAFVLTQLFIPGGAAVTAAIPPEILQAASRMNLAGAGLLFVLVMVLVTREFSRSENNLDAERAKNENLLKSLYPQKVLERMLSGETYIAERRDRVAILFCDLVGFTAMSRVKSPGELVDLLNQLYSDFDEIAVQHGVEKIKTIGDSYMAVAGIFSEEGNPARAMAAFARDTQNLVREKYTQLNIRIGIHVGTVMAGILGRKKQSFDVWGDAVNFASRLEGAATPGQILCSAEFISQLGDLVPKQPGRKTDLKGIGIVECFEL